MNSYDVGDLKIPAEWEGQKIIGLGDGEYLETDELVPQEDEVHFDASSLELALGYVAKGAGRNALTSRMRGTR